MLSSQSSSKKQSGGRVESASGMLIAMTMKMIPVASPLVGPDVDAKLRTLPGSLLDSPTSPKDSEYSQAIRSTDDIFLHPSDRHQGQGHHNKMAARRKISDMLPAASASRVSDEFSNIRHRVRPHSQLQQRSVAVDDSFLLESSSDR